MFNTSYASREEMAAITARMLFEIKAVHFRPEDPYILTSGLASPVYIDCRKLISYPRIRATLMDFAVCTLVRNTGYESFDAVAGGETAGIPFAAWISEAIREAGGVIDHTLVVFYYDIFEQAEANLKNAGLQLHYLATWRDVLAASREAGHFDESAHVQVEAFLNDPIAWSEKNGGDYKPKA